MNKQEIEKVIKSMRNLDELISITESEHESVRMAISALEKQIPKKIIPKVFEDGYIGCPSCKNKLFDNQLFCDRCGQRLDGKDE